ncbi:VCBS repeat-containing protein [Reichenbachiella ulvae]|uniref:VCBS repeat-containing protein n=1 Tax=Reichenbachiella ulvae TaxID=2980104 RepID=A0ABT3CND1_9BACT|nr:VCBS repeat-containing protein [Reichenbachiella ulvae]MCV9385191.1 VCBS repeat-containing protein [Reichenbachiella ulvae]
MREGLLKVLCALLVVLFGSCQKETSPDSNSETQYLSLPPVKTGIDFTNLLTETEEVNYFTYPYIYMGGGVAIGDINNDGLQDLYFTANMGDNKLYLNKGGMKFEDITEQAGVGGDERWDTGVTMADVNGDGWMDIYVSVSGKWASNKNLLYINNGDMTFTEQAEAYGIADAGRSTQGTFFDYDNDGDLDLYVANYPATKFDSPNFVYSTHMKIAKHQTSNHLYRNDGGKFTDVTEEAGVQSYSLSLSATIGDFDQNGFQDIYVSNDFASPDFFYFNQGDGTFLEKIKETTRHTAYYGMGVDVADFNNDGLLDICQVDMAPADNFRSKANMASMNPPKFHDMIAKGLHYQYMENALQLNHGIMDNGLPIFGDVSRMTGTALTDWSWSPLFLDMDNDGDKDLHITNGSRRDINNKDYFNQFEKKYFPDEKKPTPLEMTLNMPTSKIKNNAYLNNGSLRFEDVATRAGLDFEGYSNGSAYADLDNDGDLDLVVNNIDDPASIYQNSGAKGNYLRIQLLGPKGNPTAIGAKVKLYQNDKIQYAENHATRGFQSASEQMVHFGIGDNQQVDKVEVTWLDGKVSILENVSANQLIKLKYQEAQLASEKLSTKPNPIFTKSDILDFKHKENQFDDFQFEVLLPHANSKFGPCMATGDLNNDGWDDLFIGGSAGFLSSIYVQDGNGGFVKRTVPTIEKDSLYEDMGALIFDANGDGFMDLYVVSGGNEYEKGSEWYQDRLYISDANGNWVRSNDGLPNMTVSGSKVKPFDFDQDGDLDLLVGGRLVPRTYPDPAKTTLLRNDSESGQVIFTDVTSEWASDLTSLGLVTDFVWVDFDKDGQQDIVLVGEWMPVTYLKREGDQFVDQTEKYGDPKALGWFYSILAEDMDDDGDVDLVAGNLGTNYKYQASEEETFDIYTDDFDENGHHDIVLGYYSEGTQFPVRGRQCSSEQIPAIKKKFENYNSFASASLGEIYNDKELKTARIHYQVPSFASVYLSNEGEEGFKSHLLPDKVQLSSVNSILCDDYDGDGKKDLLMAGNLYASEVETKRNDASVGMLLKGDGAGSFTPLAYKSSGFATSGDSKSLASINTPKGQMVIVVNNNDQLDLFIKN